MKNLLLILLFLPMIGFGQCVLPMIGFGQCVSGDCENGYGTYTFSDGDKYEGEFKDNLRHGQGTYTYASGDKHIIDEYGTHPLSDGDKYVGKWKDDAQHGYGTLMKSDNANTIIWYGIWKNGELISEVLHPSELGFEPEDSD